MPKKAKVSFEKLFVRGNPVIEELCVCVCVCMSVRVFQCERV